MGEIKFKMCDGREMLLKGVKHVPELWRNLISFGDASSLGGVGRGPIN